MAEASPAQRKEMAMRRASATGCLLVLGGFLANPLGEAVTTFAAERTSEPAIVEGPNPTLAPPEAVPATPLPVPSRASARATLGVQLLPLTTAGDPYRSPVAEGALIGSILSGSPADRAGLPLGGVIVAIDGRKVGSPADAVRIIHSATPEQQVEVKYYDGNRLFRKKIQLAPATVAEPWLPPQDLLEAPTLPMPPQIRSDGPYARESVACLNSSPCRRLPLPLCPPYHRRAECQSTICSNKWPNCNAKWRSCRHVWQSWKKTVRTGTSLSGADWIGGSRCSAADPTGPNRGNMRSTSHHRFVPRSCTSSCSNSGLSPY